MNNGRSFDELNVILFCGGRGSASIIRELLRRPRVRLSLLVNAYDDGLSTGALRDFIGGMLGPSDFRKNLSYLLDLYSAQQFALQQLLEYRLPADLDGGLVAALQRFSQTGDFAGLPAPLGPLLAELDEKPREKIAMFLAEFFRYASAKESAFEYADCSFGNLMFAGAYLKTGSFNAATRELALVCASQAELINVSQGECRTLVGLKEDGEILACEAEIVDKQSQSPIRSVYFLERRLSSEDLAPTRDMSLAEKEAWLKGRQLEVRLSEEAAAALARADVIIYGPGTQHSSLLPSYRIADEAIRNSPAPIKALVVNLAEDHDIQGWTATGLVDKVLTYLSDSDNAHRVVTHVLYNRSSDTTPGGVRWGVGGPSGEYRGARVIADNFRNPVKATVHNGHALVRRVMAAVEDRGEIDKLRTLDIYVDLVGRAKGLDSLLQEFLELDWARSYRSVRLRINHLPVPDLKLPPNLQIESTDFAGEHTESLVLRNWITEGDSDFLATLTGDGEYRLRDVLVAANLIDEGSFAVVFGSRQQSRRQLRSFLHSAYGEGGILYRLSRIYSFLLMVLYFVRFGTTFSDPFTGFRVYKRVRLHPKFVKAVQNRLPATSSSATNILIKNGVEIAEVPVAYRTFAGYTKPGWRIRRAVGTLVDFFVGATR